MKPFSVKLEVILIGLVIFGRAEAWGEDWRFFADSELGTFFYNPESITRPSKNIVRVRTKQVFTDKARSDMAGELGSRYGNTDFAVDLWELNCPDKTVRLLSSFSYSEKGEVLDSNSNDLARWNFFASDTINDILYKAVCK